MMTDIIRQKLHAVAYCSDIETEEYDLEKLGRDHGGKSALFTLKDSHFTGFIKLSMVVMFDIIKIFD